MASKNSQTPLQIFTASVKSNRFVFVVFYRGHWCPFCRAYLKQLVSITPTIESLGGKTLIVTSEPSEHLPSVLNATGYKGEAITDIDNLLATYLREQGWLDIAISQKSGYVNGMAQPGVLVIRQKDKMAEELDVEVLEKWAIVPSLMNIDGARDRPDLQQILENVSAKLNGEAVVHRKYKTIDVLHVIWGYIFG